MILVSMDKLSLSELRSIAEQESIDNYLTMDRTELIQILRDKYEEEEDSYLPDERLREHNLRYVSGISTKQTDSSDSAVLPGEEELPENYQDTAVHLLYKNSNWGYVFWSISSIDMKRVESEGMSLVLFVTVKKADGSKDQYDIAISPSDFEWNIAFSDYGGVCTIAIIAVHANGERETLARSKPLTLNSSYWLKHPEEMRCSDRLFKVYLSLITTKEGDLIDNQMVNDIVLRYEEECR